MQTKEYIVALKKGVDYNQFWLEMETGTSGLPHIPDRPVSVTNNRSAFERICEYALTDEEAERVRNDPRVIGIEIPINHNPFVSIVDTAQQVGNFNKTTSKTGLEINWGLIRHGNTGNVYGASTTTTLNYNYALDGTGVDVVINDSGIQEDHPEFAGRIVNVNWNSYQSSYTTNSYIDTDGHGTHVAGIAAGTTYGWAKKANVIPLKGSGADPLDVFEALINWHRSKNGSRPTVVNMSWELRIEWNSLFVVVDQNGNRKTYVDPETNLPVPVDYQKYIIGGKWRGENILPWQNNLSDIENFKYYLSKGLIPLKQGLPIQNPTDSLIYLPYSSNTYNAALGEVIDAGIIVVQAAGNNSFKMDKPTDQGGSGDYDNYFDFSVKKSPRGIFSDRAYYHRGSSPKDPRVIVVGNLDSDLLSGMEKQRASSTRGPRIDIYAAGTNIMSSVSNFDSTGTTYQHGDTNFKQGLKSGTSMSAPQITGMCALYLQRNPTATIEEIKAWIKNNAIYGKLHSTGKNDDYDDYFSLLGGINGIAYQNLNQIASDSYVKDNTGEWKKAKSVYVKHTDGTWKRVRASYIKTESGWQQSYGT